MKTVREVEAALNERYNGPTDQVQGSGGKMYTYVPWEENVRVLDRIFGAGNWSEEPVAFSGDAEHGIYTAAVKVTGRAYDEETKTVVEFSRAGFSTSTAGATKAEREAAQAIGNEPPTVTRVLDLHETAADGAASLAFGKACKKLGDAFALYLYTEGRASKGQSRQPTGYQQGQGQAQGQRPAFSGQIKEPGAPATPAQIGALAKYGIDGSGMTKGEASAAIDAAKKGGAPAPRAAAPQRARTPDDLDELLAAA